MAVLEPVVATLIANTTEFMASMEAVKGEMDEVAVKGAAAGDAGGLLGAGLGAGARDAESGLKDTETAAKDATKAAEDSSGKFSLLGDVLGGIGGPLGNVSNKTKDFSNAAKDAGEKSNGLLSKLSDIPTPVLAIGAAVVAVGAVTVDMASKYQTATDQIAASEGITVQAAKKVGDAFLTTAGTTTFSAQQIAAAFAGVAGQAKTIQGSALTSKQSLGLMQNAMDLAEASGTSLSSAASDVTGALQGFGLGISKSPLVANVLFNAANKTGNSVDSLSASLTRAKSQMGVSAPPIQDLGGLLLDLAQHGERGRSGISALGSAFTGIIAPTAAVTAAQKFMGVTFTNAKGALLPLSQIIGELQPKLAGMSSIQAAATLKALGFGSAANKLVTTIQAGSAVFDKDTAAVEKHNSASEAAKKATEGMKASFEKAKSGIEDAAIALGEKLMPIVTEVAQAVDRFITNVVKDWPKISSAIKTGIDAIKPALTVLWDVLKAVFGFIIDHKPILIAVLAAIAVAFFPVTSAVIGLMVVASELIKHWGAVEGFFKSLWKDVKDVFLDAWNFVKNIFLNYTPDGLIISHWRPILGFFQTLWSDVTAVFSNAWHTISSGVSSAINDIVGFFKGLYNGVVSVVGDVVSFIGGLPGKILGLFADAGTWLFDIGKKIITGLWDGLKAAWKDVTGWFSSLGGIISNLKGPPAKDAVLLVENGRLIMQGFAQGLQGGWATHVVPTLQGMTTALGGGISGNLSIGGSSGSSGGAIGGGATVLNVTTPIQVNGQTLAQIVTQYQLKGSRATGNVLGQRAGGTQNQFATSTNANAVPR